MKRGRYTSANVPAKRDSALNAKNAAYGFQMLGLLLVAVALALVEIWIGLLALGVGLVMLGFSMEL